MAARTLVRQPCNLQERRSRAIPWIREQRFTTEKRYYQRVRCTAWWFETPAMNLIAIKGYKRTGRSSPVLFGSSRTCSHVGKHGPTKVFTVISKSLRLGRIFCRSHSKQPQWTLHYSYIPTLKMFGKGLRVPSMHRGQWPELSCRTKRGWWKISSTPYGQFPHSI